MSIMDRRTMIIVLVALAVGATIGIGATRIRAEMPGSVKATTMAANSSPPAEPVPAGGSAQSWDPFPSLRNMQMQMDQMLAQMSDEFRSEPQFTGMPDSSGYSLSLNVQDLKNEFQVTAFLPDTKASDVNVTMQSNRSLKVDVSNHEDQTSKTKNTATEVTDWGQYEQVIDLPAPVRADQMKIEHKGHELIITLPKL